MLRQGLRGLCSTIPALGLYLSTRQAVFITTGLPVPSVCKYLPSAQCLLLSAPRGNTLLSRLPSKMTHLPTGVSRFPATLKAIA